VNRLTEQQQFESRTQQGTFSLSSPEGGEGRGEEADCFQIQIPSPQPSPRLGGEREWIPGWSGFSDISQLTLAATKKLEALS
jgi:hypothetical protein